MADVLPLKLDQTTGLIKQFSSGDTISTTIAPGSGGGGSPVVIRPSQITSNQNDYSPTDWATCTLAIISGDNGFRQIRGFSATGISDGEEKVLFNSGAYSLVLIVEHTGSTAANRISCPFGFILMPNRGVTIVYDSTATRWRVVGEYDVTNIRGLYLQKSGFSPTAGDFGDVRFDSSSGSLSTVGGYLDAPPGWKATTSTSSTGTSFVGLGKGMNGHYITGGHICGVASVYFDLLSTSSERYIAGVRFANSAAGTWSAANQFGVKYSDNLNSGKWQFYVIDGSGAETTLDTGVTVSSLVVYKIRIEVAKEGIEFICWINDVYVGMILPTTAPLSEFIFQSGIRKTVGTTSTGIIISSLKSFTCNV